MWLATNLLSRTVVGFVLGLSLATSTLADTPTEVLSDAVARIEDRLDGRVGIALVDTGTGFSWQHRVEERFLMNSIVKAPLCGVVLARRDAGILSLADELPVRDVDLLEYAPVAETYVGGNMSISELCFAAVDMSDNTATNLLIDYIGGPQAVTDYFISIGDSTSRLDRREPELNTFAVGDLRDTTTPAAMAKTLDVLLLGDVLAPESRDQLTEWMGQGSVTGAFLRKDVPQGWAIFDKSGGGSHTRNIVGIVAPEGRSPWIVTIFISDADVDFDTRDAALQELSAAVMAVIRG